MLIFLFGREKLVFLLTNAAEKRVLGLKSEGYLHDIGWVQSIKTESVVDIAGQPIPWITYPAIAFLSGRLNKDLELFEFGSGNSTLYYAERVALVKSVENDQFWYEKIKTTMPANSELFYSELVYGGAYCTYAAKTNRLYDIIVVDGRDRVNCCKNSIASLKPGGVVILDDAERSAYHEGVGFMLKNGFKKIDFWGMAPLVNYQKCTTLFYRDGNCFAI